MDTKPCPQVLPGFDSLSMVRRDLARYHTIRDRELGSVFVRESSWLTVQGDVHGSCSNSSQQPTAANNPISEAKQSNSHFFIFDPWHPQKCA